MDFSHTFIRRLAVKEESLYKLRALTGNSLEICRRHYVGLIPDTMRDCVEFEVRGSMRWQVSCAL